MSSGPTSVAFVTIHLLDHLHKCINPVSISVYFQFSYQLHAHAQIPLGTQGVWTPLKNHKNIGFLCNTGPDPLKTTKLSSQHSMFGHHRFASETPFVVVFGSSLPSPITTEHVKVGPPLTKLSWSAHDARSWYMYEQTQW